MKLNELIKNVKLKEEVSLPKDVIPGNQIMTALNDALISEVTAVCQYMIHSELMTNWGYEFLGKAIKGRAMTEMKHAEALIERIVFLEGVPDVQKLDSIHIGKDVKEILSNDMKAEQQGIKDYRKSIKLAIEEGDAVSRKIFEENLKAEEEHIDFAVSQLNQIDEMGIENYLANIASK